MRKNFLNWQKFAFELESGVNIKEMINIKEEDMHKLYKLGFTFFENKNYDLAASVFQQLAILDHGNFSYLFALGLSYYHLTQYDDAAYCFVRCMTIEFTDPRSAYFLGVILEYQGDRVEAKRFFRLSFKLSKNSSAQRIWRLAAADKLLKRKKPISRL